MKKRLQIFLAAAAVVIFCGFGRARICAAESENVIAEGVWIGNVDVSGMTKEQAKDAIDRYMSELSNTRFFIKGEKGSVPVTAKELGLYADTDQTLDEALEVGRYGNLIQRYKEANDLKNNHLTLDLKLGINRQRTAHLIYDNTAELESTPKDAGLELENGRFIYLPGQNGSRIQIVDSVLQIEDFIRNEWDGSNHTLALVTQKVKPRGTEEELLRVRNILGTFTTSYTSSDAGRSQNVENGCRKLNGTLLYPGDELSVYQIVSPFTEGNGYAIGYAFSNGTTVESIGGGICQVASTLYNAAIRAELRVTMRYNHSMLVGYVDPSDDAAIAGTYKDLRFVNNLDIPIYIEGYCKNKKITFNIYGEETRPSQRVVSFESETLSETDPGVEFQLNDKKALGYYHVEQAKHMGNKSQLWKIVKVDGEEVSREIFNKSTYRSSVKIVSVGTYGATSEQVAAIKNAVKEAAEKKDENIVKNLVKELQDSPAKPGSTGETDKPDHSGEENESTEQIGEGDGQPVQTGEGSDEPAASDNADADNGAPVTPPEIVPDTQQ